MPEGDNNTNQNKASDESLDGVQQETTSIDNKNNGEVVTQSTDSSAKANSSNNEEETTEEKESIKEPENDNKSSSGSGSGSNSDSNNTSTSTGVIDLSDFWIIHALKKTRNSQNNQTITEKISHVIQGNSKNDILNALTTYYNEVHSGQDHIEFKFLIRSAFPFLTNGTTIITNPNPGNGDNSSSGSGSGIMDYQMKN